VIGAIVHRIAAVRLGSGFALFVDMI